ncbi:hypothetical protein OG455_28135 [Kitasatospora sp. NBC_01287]|uniref:hypothetical protein n=1 Tax=Kitasatospora sp. NBC_01287 TaxID=2903573 RepID=UPI00225BAE6D|nr:hypothetical protein [Kitasatospora sp. NBC_01287]MCX4749331.1 hypothetical protein [Kitasatospora sp. NBC_01287]
MEGAAGTGLWSTAYEPLLVDAPPGAETGVLFVHAPGENRTGGNYLFAGLARAMAAEGMLAARFDLAGCGESLREPEFEVWEAQVADALDLLATRAGLRRVHVVARGAGAALLPAASRSVAWPRVAGLRVALSPPLPRTLLDLLDLLDLGGHVDDSGEVTVRGVPSGALAACWAAAGVEPNLIGGLSLPTAALRACAAGLARPAWDVEAGAATQPFRVPERIVVTEADPLLRLQAARIALAALLTRRLSQGES